MSTLLYSPKTPTSMIVSSPTLADRSYRDMYMQSYQTRPQIKTFASPTVGKNLYHGGNLRLNTSISNTSNHNDSNYMLSTETDPLFKTNQLLKKSNYDLMNQIKQYETEPIMITSTSHVDNTNVHNITSTTPARYHQNPNELRQYNDKLRAELAMSTQKNSELITINDNILRKTEEAINYNTALKAELNQLEEDIKNEISANNDLKAKYNDILKQYTSEYQDKQRNISALQAQNEKAIAQNAQLQRENERLRSDISQYESLIANFKHTIQQLSNTEIVDKYENEIKSRLQDKERELNEKDDYIQSLFEKNEILKQEIKNKQMQLTQLKDTLSQKEQELPNIYELQRELENYDERIKTLNEISNQKELTIKHLQQSYDTLYSALYKTKNQNEDYESKYLEEKENNEMLEKKINELNALAKGVADSREEMKNKYEEALTKLNNAVKQLDELNPQSASSLGNTNDIKQQIELLEQENKALKEKNIMIMGKMEKLPEIEKKFDEIVKENEQLIKDNAELMKEVQEYKEIDEQYEGIENAENGGDYEEGEELQGEEQNQQEGDEEEEKNNNNNINDGYEL
jgi:chromosome segregation ATPase